MLVSVLSNNIRNGVAAVRKAHKLERRESYVIRKEFLGRDTSGNSSWGIELSDGTRIITHLRVPWPRGKTMEILRKIGSE